MIERYDLVVIGSGPGGYETAIKASLKGLKVAIVERGAIGGTCLNVGCMPTKALYQSAKKLKELNDFSQFGIEGITEYSVNFKRVMERKQVVVEHLRKGVINALNQSWVRIYEGSASFIDDERIHISHPTENQTIGYKHCIIATGAKPILPPIKGRDLDGVLTSTELLELDELPKRLAIIGGGVIGCEIAAIYRQFGTEVVLIEALERILMNVDKDLSSRLKAMMKKDGIVVHTSTRVEAISNGDGELSVLAKNKKGQAIEIPASHVLLAVGRETNIDHLNLEAIGVEKTPKGIVVNEQFMTTKEGVYAIGDCIGGEMLAHVATAQGAVALSHLIGHMNYTNFAVVPSCVFTFPEIATVGLDEETAKDRYGDNIQVAKALYRANGKAQTMGTTDGFVKLIAVEDRLIGAHIIGESASTLIHEASVLINERTSIKQAVDMIHAHPTLSEVLLDALRGLHQ